MTHTKYGAAKRGEILIHTSVKLVTSSCISRITARSHFNPHEREARDSNGEYVMKASAVILIHTSVKLVTEKLRRFRRRRCDFNPHEREARDD